LLQNALVFLVTTFAFSKQGTVPSSTGAIVAAWGVFLIDSTI